MSVRTALVALTALTAETAACAADGVDLPGMLADAAGAVADAMRILNVMIEFIPAGSNKTALQTQLTALT